MKNVKALCTVIVFLLSACTQNIIDLYPGRYSTGNNVVDFRIDGYGIDGNYDGVINQGVYSGISEYSVNLQDCNIFTIEVLQGALSIRRFSNTSQVTIYDYDGNELTNARESTFLIQGDSVAVQVDHNSIGLGVRPLIVIESHGGQGSFTWGKFC